VVAESLSRGAESPLLGFGAPRTTHEGAPPPGSHGLLWYLVYAHGFVAAGLFVGWLLGALRTGVRLATDRGIWLTTVVLMTCIQIVIYDLLPHVALLGLAAGLISRSSLTSGDERDNSTTESV
jgi:hypothetical protein